MKFAKTTGIILSAAITAAAIPPTYAADEESARTSSVTADKTAQWTAQEKSAGYDLRIHGWSSWETAAYIGFTLPSDFEPEGIQSAELVVNTTGVSNSSTAYIYAAEYGGFENNIQYEGSAEAPPYTASELSDFTSPSAVGNFYIDVTEYISGLAKGTENAAFRLDVKSQNTDNRWVIGSCGNGGIKPVLKLDYGDSKTGIQNPRFSDGTNGWTLTNTENITVSEGVLTAQGADYEAKISQTVTGLENGSYNLYAAVTSTDISGTCYLYGKTAGHTTAQTSVPQVSAATRIVVPGITVEDGSCEIGMYVKGSSTVTLDNLSLEKTENTRIPFLKGGEISSLTYVEDMGGKFYRADGTEGDALQIMAENGFNLARIRIMNDPGKGHGDGYYYQPAGYENEEDCLRLARRAKDKGMKIEFTFAYTDYWPDADKQIIPHEWREEMENQGISGNAVYDYLENKTYEYTKDIMQKLIAQGTCPEYVSIGNEMHMGMLFGTKESHNNGYYNADILERYVKAGAKAVRETAPDTKIILHSDNGGKVSKRPVFISLLSRVSDYYDVIGASFYPFYNADVSIDTVVNEFNSFISKYNKDVIIMETGYNWNPTKPVEADGSSWPGQLKNSGYYENIYGNTRNGQRAFLTELYAKLKLISGGRCIGDMYWDPVFIYDGGTGKIGWAIKESDDTTDSNVIPNSTLFDFEGKATEGQLAMKYNNNSSDNIKITGTVYDPQSEDNTATKLKNTAVKLTVNGKEFNTSTDSFGQYIASVPYPEDGKLNISMEGYDASVSKSAPSDGVLVSGVDFGLSSDDNEAKPEIESLDLKTGIMTIKNNSKLEGEAKGIIAFYNAEGALIQIRISNNTASAENSTLSFTDIGDIAGTSVKGFLWKSSENGGITLIPTAEVRVVD